MPPLWIVLTLLPILGGAERFNCRTRILGAYYADAKSGCKAFHVCVRVAGGGIRDFRFFCPPGTLFHQEAQTCTDWGDDDPLACPADLYDGFDTKKLSTSNNRDEESEFGLQRAETGDRRLSQSQSQSSGASDLRAAHSSDFFSGQRERGRDDFVPSPQSSSRQSFRRPTTSRQYYSSTQSTTQHTTLSPFPPSPQPSSPAQYEGTKRKLVRKRPIYVSTPAPATTLSQNTQSTQSFSEPVQQKQQQQSFEKYFQAKQRAQPAQQTQPAYTQAPQQQQPPLPQEQQQQQYQRLPQQKQYQSKQQPFPQQQQFQPQQNQQQLQQPQYQSQQHIRPQPPPQPQYYQRESQQYQSQQQNNRNYDNTNNRSPQNRPQQTTPPPSLPAQFKEYKDEYVEVPRVTPKQRYFPTSPPAPFSQTTSAQPFNKKDGLVELYNYDSQSTPGINDNRAFKVRNSFSVTDVPRDPDFVRTRNNLNTNNGKSNPTTSDYSTAITKSTNTPAFRNYNSVTYEPEKNNFVSIGKQTYFNNPSTTPTTTTFYTTSRPEPPANLNTVAYNTNIGFNVPSNFGQNDEDDGQYRPSEDEDDGQYKPELYERELLSGAHSLNIAASGNRLPEDQKSRGKTQVPNKSSQTAAPRPFRPAPTPTAPSTIRTTDYTEQTYSTTSRPQTVNTQRTFDYYQTYTTTSRPIEPPPPLHLSVNKTPASSAPSRPTTSDTRAPETRPPPPPTVTPKHIAPSPPPSYPKNKHIAPSPPPSFSRPVSDKEDNSYDYAYYDTDPGFSEYDRIEEFGKTHVKS
ncbi:uncharacterized protein LOC128670747 isoform X2 [Plodia interpunctella]|uniref:uncharacterized protein LOC128670747 isoform X2 n=1 Tax=Plodia interpunctella TaxID=58824 RepID=UPI0023688048|nr:uncharacterized protein LOC128670747 isoform X2 [Plodia interpunctella]